jgi:hypothetical protein
MWNKIVGFVGPTGSGKSYEAARLYAETERAAVYQVVRKEMAFMNVATDWFDGDILKFCLALAEPEFRYVYRVEDKDFDELQGNKFLFPDFDPFVKCCLARENMLMVIDEAHFMCSAHYMPARLRKAVVTGRHMFLDIFYLTQSLAMIHKDLRLNTHEFRFWHIQEPADLSAIAERCGQEVAQQVSSLRRAQDNRKTGGGFVPGQMLVWNSHTKEVQIYDMRSMQSRRFDRGLREAHADASATDVPATRNDRNGINPASATDDGTD